MSANKTAINSFNANHESYDLLRPSFIKTLVDDLFVGLKLATVEDDKTVYHTNKKVLEVAAGTGKFTKHLVDNGWTDNLIVVEPSKGMIDSFKKNYPQIETHLASSYEIPLPDNSVDAVIVAQGFHWFSDLSSLKEINRVVKPGGSFGCIWNYDYRTDAQVLREPLPEVKILFEGVDEGTKCKILDDVKDVDIKEKPLEIGKRFFELHPWHNFVSSYIYGFDIKVPQYRHGKWRDILSTENEYFHPISKESFLFYFVLIAPEKVYDYWGTRSYITDLPEDERLKIKQKVDELVRNNVTEHDKVKEDGKVLLRKSLGTHAVVVEVKK